MGLLTFAFTTYRSGTVTRLLKPAVKKAASETKDLMWIYPVTDTNHIWSRVHLLNAQQTKYSRKKKCSTQWNICRVWNDKTDLLIGCLFGVLQHKRQSCFLQRCAHLRRTSHPAFFLDTFHSYQLPPSAHTSLYGHTTHTSPRDSHTWMQRHIHTHVIYMHIHTPLAHTYTHKYPMVAEFRLP